MIDDQYGESYTQLTLTQLKVGVREMVSPFVAESMRLDVMRDEVTRNLIYGLSAYVLADQLPPETLTREQWVTFEHAANWREQWKAEHAERWYGRLILRWWPVKPLTVERRKVTATWDLARYRTFPKAGIAYPDRLGSPVCLAIMNPVDWTGLSPK